MTAEDRQTGNGSSAWELIHTLLQFGPRTPESDAEKKTASWLTGQLDRLGLSAHVLDFEYGRETKGVALWALVAPWGLLLCGLLAGFGPVLLLALAVVLLMAFDFLWLPQWIRSSRDATGHNIVAGVTRPWDQIVNDPRRLILLCAHYDTAEGARSKSFDLQNMREALDSLALGGVALLFMYLVLASVFWAVDWFFPPLTLFAAAQWLWSSIGVWLFLALLGPLVLVLTWNVALELADRPFMANPGADDNSSGVACVLDLAHKYAATKTPREVDIAVAFWGAEEVGLQGARAFLREHADSLPTQTSIINVDAVGRGDTLLLMVGTGLFSKQPAANELTQKALAIAAQHFVGHWAPVWLTFLTGSTDQAAWLRAGFKSALTVSHGGIRRNPLVSILYRLFRVPVDPFLPKWGHAHKPEDNLMAINPAALDRTQRFVSLLIDDLGEIN